MVAAYAVPAIAVWAGVGLALAALPLAPVALAVAVAYGGYYGAIEVSRHRGLPPPGRRWQVPQTMLIRASPARRVLVWGAILGPGFATRNPYAGFGALLLAVAAMRGAAAGLALGAAIGLAHGTARAISLLRDVRELGQVPVLAGAGAGPGEFLPTHLGLLLKTAYWRRLDGTVLLAVAATAAVCAVGHVT